VKQHAQLHLLHIYHILIWTELKYLIGGKVLSLQKWGSAVCKARPKFLRFGCSLGLEPLITRWLNSLAVSTWTGQREPGTIANTICLWAFACVGSGVNVRSGLSGSIVSSSGVSSGGGAPGTLCMARWLVDYLIDGHLGAQMEVKLWRLGWIATCRRQNAMR